MAKPRAKKRTSTKRTTAKPTTAKPKPSSRGKPHEYPGAWTPGQPGEPRWLAQRRVIWVDANGTRRMGRIAIAQPEPHPDASSSCSILVDCRDPRARAIYGGDDLQALLLALQLAGSALHQFIQDGGRILDPDGANVPIDAYFGPLLRAAKQ